MPRAWSGKRERQYEHIKSTTERARARQGMAAAGRKGARTRARRSA